SGGLQLALELLLEGGRRITRSPSRDEEVERQRHPGCDQIETETTEEELHGDASFCFVGSLVPSWRGAISGAVPFFSFSLSSSRKGICPRPGAPSPGLSERGGVPAGRSSTIVSNCPGAL